MVYDFVAKIKHVKNEEIMNEEALDSLVDEINTKFESPLDLKFVLPDFDKTGEILVKSQTSVSSMPNLHDKELEMAIEAFKSYLEEIAKGVDGEVSQQDGFYNNSKTFRRLFS